MRPRTTGITTAAQQPPQSFKPKSEWKHEHIASFLFVYLPGFAVEQLKITSDYSNRTVKVEGQRRLPNGRLLPVNEIYNIPEEYDLSKMDRQLGRGVLMLKLPRNIVIPPQQPTTKETEEDTPKPQQTVGDSIAQWDEDMYPPEKTSKRSPDRAAIVPPVGATGDEKSTMTPAKSDEEKLVQSKEDNDGNGKPGKPESPGVKEEESKAESRELDMSVAQVEEKEIANASTKNGMVKELNGDRKLIVNMGAAVLIIIGLVISLFYTLGQNPVS